jgi:uncharacterized protein (DUF488 family)
MRVLTIGAYGYNDATIRDALANSGIDLFVDIRRRRGVRGSEYAFANSTRLQALLAELDIPYLHRPDLAPTDDVRRAQVSVAAAEGIAYRQRDSLSDAFIAAYEREVLDGFDSEAFVESLGPGVESIALFCVERVPQACHRSLLAARLERDLGATVEHLIPSIG